MDVERFAASPVGRLVDFSGVDPRDGRPFRQRAYVPHPLPADVHLDRPTVNALGGAMWAIGRLDQAVRWVVDPMLYMRPAIRREAVSTSALEGTFAAFDEVMGAEVWGTGSLDPDLNEVLNFVRAAEMALEWVRERPVTISLLCELQRTLMAGTEGDGATAGRIRETPVIIGPRGCPVESARFIPPLPGADLRIGVQQWLEWSEQVDAIPLLVRLALSHYQFETLHPFTDGNGRIGRLVSLLQLVRAGVLEHPMLSLSTWLYARRDEYVDHLLEVSATGDFDPWIRFFIEAVTDEANAAVDRITAAQAWRHTVSGRIRDSRIRAGAVHAVADGLVGHPVVTATWVQHRYSVSYPTANAAIQKLVDLGILRETTGRTYGRVLAAWELLHIFQVATPRQA